MKSTISILITIAAITLTGCNASLFSYKGATITQPDHMIQLQQGDQQGIWKTNELALNYRYQMTPESLKISGAVKLLGGFATGFNSVNRLDVQLLFLDSQGTVIDNVYIYSAVNYPRAVERTISIPPGATAISFTYDGELLDAGDDFTGISIGNFPR